MSSSHHSLASQMYDALKKKNNEKSIRKLFLKMDPTTFDKNFENFLTWGQCRELFNKKYPLAMYENAETVLKSTQDTAEANLALEVMIAQVDKFPKKFHANDHAYIAGIYHKSEKSIIRQDDKKAFHFMKLAAENEEAQHAISQKNLGMMYLEGIGTPQDLEMAFKWFKKLYDAGKLTNTEIEYIKTIANFKSQSDEKKENKESPAQDAARLALAEMYLASPFSPHPNSDLKEANHYFNQMREKPQEWQLLFNLVNEFEEHKNTNPPKAITALSSLKLIEGNLLKVRNRFLEELKSKNPVYAVAVELILGEKNNSHLAKGLSHYFGFNHTTQDPMSASVEFKEEMEESAEGHLWYVCLLIEKNENQELNTIVQTLATAHALAKNSPATRDASLTQLKSLQERHPNDTALSEALGDCYRREAEFADKISHLTSAQQQYEKIKEQKQSPNKYNQTCYELGRLHQGKKSHTKAFSHFQKAKENGDILSKWATANAYSKGWHDDSLKPDIGSALSLYQELLDQANGNNIETISEILRDLEDLKSLAPNHAKTLATMKSEATRLLENKRVIKAKKRLSEMRTQWDREKSFLSYENTAVYQTDKNSEIANMAQANMAHMASTAPWYMKLRMAEGKEYLQDIASDHKKIPDEEKLVVFDIQAESADTDQTQQDDNDEFQVVTVTPRESSKNPEHSPASNLAGNTQKTGSTSTIRTSLNIPNASTCSASSSSSSAPIASAPAPDKNAIELAQVQAQLNACPNPPSHSILIKDNDDNDKTKILKLV